MERGGSYLLPVKENQSSLHADLVAAFSPWAATGPEGFGPPAIPVWWQPVVRARGGQWSATTLGEPKVRHGRREVRMLWPIADPALNAYSGSSGTVGQPWPGPEQVARVER